ADARAGARRALRATRARSARGHRVQGRDRASGVATRRAALSAELGDDRAVGAAHRYVVDAVPPEARTLAGFCDELVVEARRRDEDDVAAGGHRRRTVRVAREGERRVREEEHEAAVADAVSVQHRLGDAEPGARGAGRDLVEL